MWFLNHIQIHVEIDVTKKGTEVASRRLWLKNQNFPGLLTFDASTNEFGRILQKAQHGSKGYRQLVQDNRLFTTNLPIRFRLEFQVKLSAAESGAVNYANILSGESYDNHNL